MPDICPEMIVRITASTPGNSQSDRSDIISLTPFSNTAMFKTIQFNTSEPVLLRLLMCRDENPTKNPDDCPCPDHKNRTATKMACRDSRNKLAQIYVRQERIAAQTRSCIIVFIERQYLTRIDELSKLLLSTVDWLGIAQERPYFYIFGYGSSGYGLTHDNTHIVLNKKIKGDIAGYSDSEEVCFVRGIIRGNDGLTIFPASRFSMKVSSSKAV